MTPNDLHFEGDIHKWAFTQSRTITATWISLFLGKRLFRFSSAGSPLAMCFWKDANIVFFTGGRGSPSSNGVGFTVCYDYQMYTGTYRAVRTSKRTGVARRGRQKFHTACSKYSVLIQEKRCSFQFCICPCIGGFSSSHLEQQGRGFSVTENHHSSMTPVCSNTREITSGTWKRMMWNTRNYRVINKEV